MYRSNPNPWSCTSIERTGWQLTPLLGYRWGGGGHWAGYLDSTGSSERKQAEGGGLQGAAARHPLGLCQGHGQGVGVRVPGVLALPSLLLLLGSQPSAGRQQERCNLVQQDLPGLRLPY